jgi:rubrerythrin
MSFDDVFDGIFESEDKAQKEYMDAKYPKKKYPYDVCLSCGFKLHSPAKKCPNCGKIMDSYKEKYNLEDNE